MVKSTVQAAPSDSTCGLEVKIHSSTTTTATTATANPACGQIVKGNVKLISNLICNNDGLIVGDQIPK